MNEKIRSEQVDALYSLVMESDQKWLKEWSLVGFEQQGFSGNVYRNANQLNLFAKAYKNNYDDPRWLTFNQIKKQGLSLQKGSKGSHITFYTKTASMIKKDENGNPILDENGKKKRFIGVLDKPVMITYTVFNASNINGIEPFKLDEKKVFEEQANDKKYIDVENMVNQFCKTHNIEKREIPSDRAFFANGENTAIINIPLGRQFSSPDSYYATLLHEVAHSTKVLNIREDNTSNLNGYQFGSKEYAREELTAELTSLYLCKEFKLDASKENNVETNSLAYIKGWIEKGVLDKEDLAISMKDAERATKVIYKEHLKLQENQTLKAHDNIKEISLTWSEHKTIPDEDKRPGKIFKNLAQVQQWFNVNFPEGDIPKSDNPILGQSISNSFTITYFDDKSKITSKEVHIDVSQAQNDFNPLKNSVKEYLRDFLESHKITDNSLKDEAMTLKVTPKAEKSNVAKQGAIQRKTVSQNL